MTDKLAEARLKLVRAQKHLDEASRLISKFTDGQCAITLEKDTKRKLYIQRIRLQPAASPEISAIAGDFFGNVRAALDYIVTQLVLVNPPNRPTKGNAFPIVAKHTDFPEIAAKRLKGVSAQAAALIESLQPYHRRDNPLGILNRLVNIDKHQSLNVVTVVADNTQLATLSGSFSMFLGEEELRDGAIFGGVGIPFKLASKWPTITGQVGKVTMQGKCSLFVAFDDPAAEELEHFRVDRTLESILEFTRDTVIPAFEPFFD